MLRELLQAIEGDNISGQFMLGILYLVVGFGILGTVLMTTMERRKEFGIMVAVGMRRSKLLTLVLIETFLLGIIGIIAGVALSIPVIIYFMHFPITITGEAAKAFLEYNMPPEMPVLLEPGFFVAQAMVVMVITLLTTLYPMRIIAHFKVVKAIKGN
jgi:ABC-type antimicrobial peptide transport system permease subunit